MPASLLDLVRQSVTHKSVVGLELLQRLGALVDQSETSGLAATVLRPQTEDGHGVLVGLVEFGELDAEVILGDVGLVWVEDVTVLLS